jgi:hypothetical protein
MRYMELVQEKTIWNCEELLHFVGIVVVYMYGDYLWTGKENGCVK